MAAPDLARVLRVGGRLAVNPSNLASAWPHGGTGLGLVQDVAIRVRSSVHEIAEEPWGIEPSEVILGGESVALVAALRTWDATALATVFPSGATGSVTGERVVTYPGASWKAGTQLYAGRVVLLFTPTDQENHPAALFYAACPVLDDDVSLRLQLDQEHLVAVRFVCARDASARVYAYGRLRDLSL